MSTALVKSKLKAAREAIGAKDYSKAEQAASDALTFESTNYNGRVFLAVAKLNLEKLDEAEEAYKTAIASQPQTLLAWQGLASFYEKTQRWNEFIDTQRKLMDLAVEADDATRCAEALQKILNCQRANGTDKEVLNVLRLFLPDSPYYPVLSNLPPPDPTAPTSTMTYEAQELIHNTIPILEQIVSNAEKEEEDAITKEINKRRTRLSVTTSAEETKKSVLREVMLVSDLPSLYEKVLAHHLAPDELRRSTEQKLLRYLHTLLLALPSPFLKSPDAAVSEAKRSEEEAVAGRSRRQKDEIRAKVEEMARGMTTLRLPDELAWTIMLEWPDMQSEDEYDVYLLKRYMDLFPNAGLSKLAQIQLGLPDPEGDEDGAKALSKLSLEDQNNLVDTAFESAQATSGRAHLLASSFYLKQKDYELVIDIAQAGLDFLRRLADDTGRQLPGLESLLETNLAISLVHFNPPYSHTRALRLLNRILERSPNDLRCLLAKAYIHEHAARWQDAYDTFSQVYEKVSEEAVKFEARAERAWCLGNIKEKTKEALEELHAVASEMDQDQQIPRERKAEAWWRYGKCLWEVEDEEYLEPCYDAFITSIKRDNTFARAFTSLGFYYLQAVSPPDHNRATKCFQKAFELDEREDVAARILATEFANSGEWDLVEVIARRVVQNAMIQPGRGAVQEPLATGSVKARQHAWAWKAIGAAELKSKRYQKATYALQSAIRGAPSDVNCWLQLAIAYRGAGKHVAALKTLVRATELDKENWHAKYLIGDIQRQMGLYEVSLASFRAVQQDRPEEFAVQVAIAETQLLAASSEAKEGFTDRAVQTLIDCLRGSLAVLQEGRASRIAWKLIGDALSKLGELAGEEDSEIRALIKDDILPKLQKDDVDSKNPLLTVMTTKLLMGKLQDSDLSAVCLASAVLCFSMRMLLEAQNEDAMGAAWHDIGHALQNLAPAYPRLGLEGDSEQVIMEAIQCIRNALQKEPLNGQYWSLLGVLAAENSPKLAQHSLIRACELNVRSAVPWTNLGLFYLQHQDYELANKAFLRAQVLDPEYPQAWMGQAALARMNGDVYQENVLTSHAASLSNGFVPDADLASAVTTLQVSQASTSQEVDYAHASFVTSRYLAKKPKSSFALHLQGLLSEKLGMSEKATSSFEKAVQALEAEYEVDESPEVERQYVIANLSLGRARLASEDYMGSVAALDGALGLLPTLADEADPQGSVLRVQCLLLKALSTFFADDAATSLSLFEEAQSTLAEMTDEAGSKFRNQATLLVAQVLYSLGGEEQQAEAERQLLDNIYDSATNQPNVPIITTLSALAIVQEKQDLLDAAMEEIVKLSVDQQIEQDPAGSITYLLAAQADSQGNHEEAISVYERALHAQPTSTKLQASLNATLQQGSQSVAEDEGVEAQHAIFRSPWDAALWEALPVRSE